MEAEVLEAIKHVAGESFAQQLLIWTTSLAVASYIHSGRVKSALDQMTMEIKGMVHSMNLNLQAHATEIAGIKVRQVEDDARNSKQDDRLSRMEQTLNELQRLVQKDILAHGGGDPSHS